MTKTNYINNNHSNMNDENDDDDDDDDGQKKTKAMSETIATMIRMIIKTMIITKMFMNENENNTILFLLEGILTRENFQNFTFSKKTTRLACEFILAQRTSDRPTDLATLIQGSLGTAYNQTTSHNWYTHDPPLIPFLIRPPLGERGKLP